MTRHALTTALTVCIGLAAGSVNAAPVNIPIDIDTTRTSGTVTTGPLVTQPGFVSWDLTNVGTSGTTITEQGVTFEIFGLAAVNQSRVRPAGDGTGNDDLTQDFVFNEGVTGRAVGLRISGLEVGTYDMQSWHFDSDAGVRANDNFIQVEVRDQGGTATTLVDNHPFGTAPAMFQFEVTAIGQVKEVIFREDDAPTANDAADQNRSRLNGFTLVTVPEPTSAGILLALSLYGLGKRRRHS